MTDTEPEDRKNSLNFTWTGGSGNLAEWFAGDWRVLCFKSG
jgi:hypothetical protein